MLIYVLKIFMSSAFNILIKIKHNFLIANTKNYR